MSVSPVKENVVVVGGGIGGTIIAKELSAKLDHSKYNLFLVELRPYLIWKLGGLRIAVTKEEGAVDNYLFNYDKFFPTGKGTVKKAKVEKIVPNSDGNGGELQLTEGDVLPYRGMSAQLRWLRSSDRVLRSPRVGDWVPVDRSHRLP